jgi:thiamine-phosphate pyrophosphorylase
MNTKSWQERLGVYLVLGIEDIGDKSALEVVRMAIAGGVDVVQLREKKAPLRDVIEVGRQMRTVPRA